MTWTPVISLKEILVGTIDATVADLIIWSSIEVEGISGANSVKVILNGEGEMVKLEISPETIKEEKSIIEDLIVAAHNDAKAKLKDMIAQESARIIAEQGFENFSAAKTKAAKFLNAEKKGCLPNNFEVERKLIQHYKIFHYKSHSNLIYSMRSIALIIMQLFNNYQPFLVGSVANGTASKSSKINIHLTSDNLEEIIHVLEKNKICTKQICIPIKYPHLNQ